MMQLYALGAGIGYQIFLAELMQYVFKAFGMDKGFVESITFRMLVNIPFAAAVLFPLSVQRDMSSLRYAGVASVAAMTYTMVVLVIEMPWYF